MTSAWPAPYRELIRWDPSHVSDSVALQIDIREGYLADVAFISGLRVGFINKPYQAATFGGGFALPLQDRSPPPPEELRVYPRFDDFGLGRYQSLLVDQLTTEHRDHTHVGGANSAYFYRKPENGDGPYGTETEVEIYDLATGALRVTDLPPDDKVKHYGIDVVDETIWLSGTVSLVPGTFETMIESFDVRSGAPRGRHLIEVGDPNYPTPKLSGLTCYDP